MTLKIGIAGVVLGTVSDRGAFEEISYMYKNGVVTDKSNDW